MAQHRVHQQKLFSLLRVVENHFVFEKVRLVESCLARLVEMLESEETVMFKVKIEYLEREKAVVLEPSKRVMQQTVVLALHQQVDTYLADHLELMEHKDILSSFQYRVDPNNHKA